MARKTASGKEAAAIAVAVASFEAELAAALPATGSPSYGAWQRAALLEGVSAKESPQDPQGGARWQS